MLLPSAVAVAEAEVVVEREAEVSEAEVTEARLVHRLRTTVARQ